MVINMNHTRLGTKKNTVIEGCKLLASLFVVFLHVPFPGNFGKYIDILSRFAVPFFFLVTGYYNYNASVRKISRRLLHIARLTLYACLFYIGWYSLLFLCYGDSVLSYLSSVFTMPKILNWLILNMNPFSDHLWYLSALLYCYIFFWIYTALFHKKAGYVPLYILGFCLLCCTLLLDGPVSSFVMYIPHYIYRNVWFMGSSGFILGIFLHDISAKYPRMLQIPSFWHMLLILSGGILALLQRKAIGASEISVGSIIAACGLLLYGLNNTAVSFRSPCLQNFAIHTGRYSTTIYIIHLAVLNLYQAQMLSHIGKALGSAEPFLRPFFIFLLSLLISVIWDHVKTVFCKTFENNSRI